VDPEQVFTLEWTIPASDPFIVAGRDYFFRVGAIIDIGESKSNYSQVVKITL
jgi:hypothetical protein